MGSADGCGIGRDRDQWHLDGIKVKGWAEGNWSFPCKVPIFQPKRVLDGRCHPYDSSTQHQYFLQTSLFQPSDIQRQSPNLTRASSLTDRCNSSYAGVHQRREATGGRLPSALDIIFVIIFFSSTLLSWKCCSTAFAVLVGTDRGLA